MENLEYEQVVIKFLNRFRKQGTFGKRSSAESMWGESFAMVSLKIVITHRTIEYIDILSHSTNIVYESKFFAAAAPLVFCVRLVVALSSYQIKRQSRWKTESYTTEDQKRRYLLKY